MKKDDHTLDSKRIISIDEAAVKDKLGEVVRDTVEETLNGLLDQEAERLCNAKKYERTKARKDTRAGYYQRTLETKAGKVELNMPNGLWRGEDIKIKRKVGNGILSRWSWNVI